MAGYAGAYVLRDALLTLGDTEFQAQVNRARLVPDTPIQQMRTLVPDGVITDVDSSTWVLELQGVQDWETGGLAAYLNTNAGELVEFELAPRNATGKKMATGSVRALPVPFGGDQGEFATFEVELPVDGAPTFSTVPA